MYPDKNHEVLALFHPCIQEWFSEKYKSPTPVQQSVWPKIAAEKHILMTAPTGSGKTLAAFLWTLNRLLISPRQSRGPSVLYVSPLKALNHDIRENLLSPLAELRAAAADRKRGTAPGGGSIRMDIKIGVRSGDTPSRLSQFYRRNTFPRTGSIV